MSNLTKTVASIAVITLLASFAIAGQTDSKKPESKKEKKDAPRKIEIAGSADKVRAALIKHEMDRGWDLGDEQINRIEFNRKPRTGLRDVFVLSSDGNSTTIYATTEWCIPPYACRVIEIYKEKANPRNQMINERDDLLDSIKTEIEARP